MLICRVQLPEDTALGQVAAPPPQASNPPAAATTELQNSATITPETQPPAVGGGAGAIGPQRPGFVIYLMEHVWNDPHLRICELWLFSPTAVDTFVNHKTGFTLSFFLTVVNQLVMLFSLPLLATAVTYSMFWLPQIVRSATRGRSAALTAEYLVGTTICRLMFAFCSYSGMIALTWADLNRFRLPRLQREYHGNYPSP